MTFRVSTPLPSGVELRLDGSELKVEDWKHGGVEGAQGSDDGLFAAFMLFRPNVRKALWHPLAKLPKDGIKVTLLFQQGQLELQLREVPTRAIADLPIQETSASLIEAYNKLRLGSPPTWASCCTTFSKEPNSPFGVAMFHALFDQAQGDNARLKTLARSANKFILNTDIGGHCEKYYNWGLLPILHDLLLEHASDQRDTARALARLGHSHFDQDFRRVVMSSFIELTEPIDAIKLSLDPDVIEYLSFMQNWVPDLDSAHHLLHFTRKSFDISQLLIRFWPQASSPLPKLTEMTRDVVERLEFADYTNTVERLMNSLELNDGPRCATFMQLFAQPERERELLFVLKKNRGARRALLVAMLGSVGGKNSVEALEPLTQEYADVAEVRNTAEDALTRIRSRLNLANIRLPSQLNPRATA